MGQDYPSEQFLEEVIVQALEMAKRDEQLGSSDDESSEPEKEQPSAGSRQSLRARARLRAHLEVLLTSRDVATVRKTMSLLEQASVKPGTRESYKKAMKEFLEFCNRQTPPANVDDPATADVALCAFANDLYARGHHKSSFERALAGVLFHLPEFGRGGNIGLPRTYRALKGYRLKCPGRSRKPHPLSFWQAFAVDLAERGHVLMAVWVLLCVHAYLRPGECMSLQRRDLVPPSVSINNFWALLLFPNERADRSKTGEADNSILLDAPWAQWMAELLQVLHSKDDASCIWNFSYANLVREFRTTSKRLGVDVVPYQCRHSGASHDRAVQLRSLLEIQKRGQWRSSRSVVRYEKSARLGQTYAQYSTRLQAWIEAVSPHVAAIVTGLRSSGTAPPHA